MNNVNKTMYIPLYGKSYVSKKGLFLNDKKAEEIWNKEGFSLKGKSKSKWLAYYMGIRSAVFDDWLKEKMNLLTNSTIVHIGCGMDSRILRVGVNNHKWYDVDFLEVISERKKYYTETNNYKMIVGDVRNNEWLKNILENQTAIIVMEGVSMYLSINEMKTLIDNLCNHFENIYLLVDCYTTFAAKMSKYKNPINDVGVTKVYGIDDPTLYQNEQLRFINEHIMIPRKYIDELRGFEKIIFSKIYAGKMSKKLYCLFEYQK